MTPGPRATFILVHHSTPPPCFRLRGYASSSRRLDIAARVLQACFCTMGETRRDVEAYVYMLDTGIALGFRGEEGFPCSEEGIMGVLRERLCSSEYEVLDPDTGLARLAAHGGSRDILALSEQGDDIYSVLPSAKRPVFILGAQRNVPETLLESLGAMPVSIGPRSYLASHVAAFVLGLLDSR